jgi:hypothetical protein
MGHSKHTQKFGSEKRQLSFKLNLLLLLLFSSSLLEIQTHTAGGH